MAIKIPQTSPEDFLKAATLNPAAAVRDFIQSQPPAPETTQRPYYSRAVADNFIPVLKVWRESGYKPRVLYHKPLGLQQNTLRTMLYSMKAYVLEHPDDFAAEIVEAAVNLNFQKEGLLGWRFLQSGGEVSQTSFVSAFLEPNSPTVAQILEMPDDVPLPETVPISPIKTIQTDILNTLTAGMDEFKRDGLNLSDLEQSAIRILIEPFAEKYLFNVKAEKIIIVRKDKVKV